ncbi:hypothetical protein [Dulcicalothrix desertica]|nr:hypothetical protein [Dulcicalothrix desertica]TWH43789.1 hypothetical protein CAL7102_07533 [Dulcicalothrix desertica PCC 7102]
MYTKTIKKKRLLIRRIKSVSVIGIAIFSLSFTLINSATAATVDTTENRNITQTEEASFDKNSSNQIQGFINDVHSFLRGDFFGGITQLVKNAIGSVQVPDLGQVVGEIMTGALPEDGQNNNKLENNLPNSYAIREDLAKQSERIGAIDVAQFKTLSKTAQNKSKETLEQSANSELESGQMSDDSQNTDTSQHILQNISRQLKNNATIANLQLQEASQARQDRALGLTLNAQTAQELNAANTRERQSVIASGNCAISQGALLVMPGGTVLGNSSN